MNVHQVTTITPECPFRTASFGSVAASARGEAYTASPDASTELEREEIRRRRCRVMVVDDEHEYRAALCTKLKRRYSVIVTEAAGPHAALRLATQHPDLQLILLDVSMPGMDGTDVCRQMRADGVTCQIVMMSAHDNAENRADADALGVRLLAKPLKEPALRQVLLQCGENPQ